jgi:hypothetical protein
MDILWACGAQDPGSTPGWDVYFRRRIGGRLEGEVAEAAEKNIRETFKELDIEIIDKSFFRKESVTKET